MFSKDTNNVAVEIRTAQDGKEQNCIENEMADKLDVLMEILFDYFHDITHINGEILH